MFISENHFLFPHVQVAIGKNISRRLLNVDTQLMVGTRLVGFDPSSGRPITDLVKVDKVFLDLGTMPEDLLDLLPDWFFHTGNIKMIDSNKQSLEEVLGSFGVEVDVKNESES